MKLKWTLCFDLFNFFYNINNNKVYAKFKFGNKINFNSDIY